MVSGKTTEFIRLIERQRMADKKCLIIKHVDDNRFDIDLNQRNHVTTHNKIKYEACDIVYTTELNKKETIEKIVKEYNVVGIEEGFFFSDICVFCDTLANNGIIVIVSTLDSSYKQELFKNIGNLIAISENVIKLKAVCMNCKQNDASFTIRTINSDQEILVGGSDIYKSVCRKCLIEFNKSKKTIM